MKKKGTAMEASNKLVRFGRTLTIVGYVLAVICLIAALGALVTAVFVVIIPENAVHTFLDRFDITSGLDFLLPGTTIGNLIPVAAMTGLKISLVVAFLSIFIYCVAAAIILFILSALFKSTATKRSPFLPENVRRLKIIGAILIVVSLLLGLHSLIYAFCILALAFMFQYGTELQQQADETL